MILDYQLHKDIELALLRNFFDTEEPGSCEKMASVILDLIDDKYELVKK